MFNKNMKCIAKEWLELIMMISSKTTSVKRVVRTLTQIGRVNLFYLLANNFKIYIKLIEYEKYPVKYLFMKLNVLNKLIISAN